MTIAELNDLSPFLAVIVSILALTVGPIISGRITHAQALASMREKWIYAFRDCLVELTTDLDVLHESCGEEGIVAEENYEEILRKLRTQENRVRLMINADEPLYQELMKSIEVAIGMLVGGIHNEYGRFHAANDALKRVAQRAIRNEWKKVTP